MKLIKPSVEILKNYLEQVDYIPAKEEVLNNIFQQIEVAGRTCFKSEDKITEDSSKAFVRMLIKKGDLSLLEQGTVYLKVPAGNLDLYHKYIGNKYSILNLDDCLAGKQGYYAVTTNYRVLVKNNWLDDLQYLCEPTEHHEKRVSVRFICDRGTMTEFLRHRTFSFVIEDINNLNSRELTFILPMWCKKEEGSYNRMSDGYIAGLYRYYSSDKDIAFIKALISVEEYYYNLLKYDNQQAKVVLPNALKTEVIMTGYLSDWKKFFEKRTISDNHPQMLQLTIPLQEAFKGNGYINN